MTRTYLLSLALALAGAGTAVADVVQPDCSNFPAGEQDPVARDRSVVMFHNACLTSLPGNCDIRHNPGILIDAEGLKSCKEGLGEIAGHVLEWGIPHACSGNAECAEKHRGLCLGKANRLQLRRRMLRCSQKARTKLDNWSAELISSQR